MLELNINESLLQNESAASSLLATLREIEDGMNFGNSAIYHQFPFYRDSTGEGLVRANILFISDIYGVLIFQCVDGGNRPTFNDVLIDSESSNLNTLDVLIFSKLIKSDILKKGRRELKFKITPVLFINDYSKEISSDYLVARNYKEVKEVVSQNQNEYTLTGTEFSELKAMIEGSKVIPRKNRRKIKNIDSPKSSKGAILANIETAIANFDSEQKRAALFTLDKPQRIRGLAGSGKTIILAMKAALLHLQDPKAEILYTYYTKALNDYVKKLITRFYRMYSENDPDWEKVHVLHAWGGKTLEGVYYNACQYNGIYPFKLGDAKRMAPNDPFSYICQELIKQKLEVQYDYALLDEAQDFPQSFYRLCRMIIKNNRVIWAYDDFQNILDVEIQNEKETFGKDEHGEYYIDFSKSHDILQDLILHKCYRNPRTNLIVAFALGLGIYNEKGKVLQRLENNDHWESLGFKVESGNSNDGDLMTISRPNENSPLIKNQLLEDGIFRILDFDNITNEIQAVVENILRDLEEELLPEDISVISLDSKYVRTYFDEIVTALEKHGVKTFNLIDAPLNNTIYRVPGHVTLSTIFKAKGNESGSVYVLGVDSIFVNKDSIVERNKLFTAITRSEAWVTLSGINPWIQTCIKEYQQLQAHDYKLVFPQPSKKSTKTIYREMAIRQEKLSEMERIAEDLKALGLSTEELKEKLMSMVFGRK